MYEATGQRVLAAVRGFASLVQSDVQRAALDGQRQPVAKHRYGDEGPELIVEGGLLLRRTRVHHQSVEAVLAADGVGAAGDQHARITMHIRDFLYV